MIQSNVPNTVFPASYVQGAPIAGLPYQIPTSVGGPATVSRSIAGPPGLMGAGTDNLFVTSGPSYLPHRTQTTVPPTAFLGQNGQSQLITEPRVIGATNFTVGEGQVIQHSQVKEGLQGYSTIEYVPYESYYIDYEERQFVQNVMVPVQRTVTDYYAVEHVVDYVPREIEETVIDYVPEEVVT